MPTSLPALPQRVPSLAGGTKRFFLLPPLFLLLLGARDDVYGRVGAAIARLSVEEALALVGAYDVLERIQKVYQPDVYQPPHPIGGVTVLTDAKETAKQRSLRPFQAPTVVDLPKYKQEIRRIPSDGRRRNANDGVVHPELQAT